MQHRQSLVRIARKLLGLRMTMYLRGRSLERIPDIEGYLSPLRGARALEIGGPSEIFGEEGFLPAYDVLNSVDNCLFAARTIWAGDVQAGLTFTYSSGKAPGRQFICEASDLKPVLATSYDCVLASHCLEHVANPLRALQEWKRCLRDGGVLLLILPHKDATFDWRRPVTPLAHIVEDYHAEVGEDDLTHLPEVLALHDLDRDKPAGSADDFRQRCLQNFANRAMHHHVFDSQLAVSLLECARFTILKVDTFNAHHIVLLARKHEDGAGN
jgi:SAM-dependent methyltransferase